MATPIELDYTNRDFDSIRAFLVSAAKAFQPEWQTVGEPADFGTLLLELYAYMGDVLNYYIDRVAAEPFLATAVRRQSILGIADMLGYTPVAQQSASGLVRFDVDENAYLTLGDVFMIEAGALVQTVATSGADAVFFETTNNVILGGPDYRTGITGVHEGRTIENEFLAISNAAPLQEYVLRNVGVVHRTVVVTVRETETGDARWTYSTHLTDTSPDASVFTTYVDDQQFMHIVFGDNAAGRIPPNGAEISVSYRYGVGAAGNVVSGTINSLTIPTTGVSVINDLGTAGGADNESVDQMRYSIPRATKMNNRAITLEDFASLALRVPGVAKAVAAGLYYTMVSLYIAPVGGGAAPDDLMDQVEAYIADRALVGTSTTVLGPIYQDLVLELDLHVLPAFGQLTVTTAVEAAITALLSFDNMSFGAHISQGEVYHACLQVAGVDYIVLRTFRLAPDVLSTVGHAVPLSGTSGSLDPVTDVAAAFNVIPVLDLDRLVITSTGGLT